MVTERTEREVIIPSPVDIVRCVMVDPRGRTLLLPDEYKGQSVYIFPGGRIDEKTGKEVTNGQKIQAANRELREETGLITDDVQFAILGSYTHIFENKGVMYHRLIHMVQAALPQVVDIDDHINQVRKASLVTNQPAHALWATPGKLEELLATNQILNNPAKIREIIFAKG